MQNSNSNLLFVDQDVLQGSERQPSAREENCEQLSPWDKAKKLARELNIRLHQTDNSYSSFAAEDVRASKQQRVSAGAQTLRSKQPLYQGSSNYSPRGLEQVGEKYYFNTSGSYFTPRCDEDSQRFNRNVAAVRVVCEQQQQFETLLPNSKIERTGAHEQIIQKFSNSRRKHERSFSVTQPSENYQQQGRAHHHDLSVQASSSEQSKPSLIAVKSQLLNERVNLVSQWNNSPSPHKMVVLQEYLKHNSLLQPGGTRRASAMQNKALRQHLASSYASSGGAVQTLSGSEPVYFNFVREHCSTTMQTTMDTPEEANGQALSSRTTNDQNMQKRENPQQNKAPNTLENHSASPIKCKNYLGLDFIIINGVPAKAPAQKNTRDKDLFARHTQISRATRELICQRRRLSQPQKKHNQSVLVQKGTQFLSSSTAYASNSSSQQKTAIEGNESGIEQLAQQWEAQLNGQI